MKVQQPTRVTGSILTGKIVQWDSKKGFGFLEQGKLRVFLHHRAFSEQFKKPEVGDTVRFTMGRDAQGRVCAENAEYASRRVGLRAGAFLLLGAFLALPVAALFRLPIDARYVAGYLIALNALTYWLYASDKRRAGAGEWRTPEATLHTLELMGGWPAAFLAQRQLRHKCSKGSYQAVFWTIVLLYQFVAVDFQMDWKLSRSGLKWFQDTSSKR